MSNDDECGDQGADGVEQSLADDDIDDTKPGKDDNQSELIQSAGAHDDEDEGVFPSIGRVAGPASVSETELNGNSSNKTSDNVDLSERDLSENVVLRDDNAGTEMLLPALQMTEVEFQQAERSSIEQHESVSAEQNASSEQPIAEFVGHQLINMEIKHIIEAALFASGSAMSVSRLLRVFDEAERPERSEIRAALTILQQDYADKAVQLVEVAGGFRFQVKADYSIWVARLFEERPPKYSRALLETLSIIAYRQPVTRGDIEKIRGVSVSSQIIHTLQEREWIKVVGHKEVPGKPALFATTSGFLDYFNLKSLTDLPPLSDFTIPDETSEQTSSPSSTEQQDQQITGQQDEENKNQDNKTQSITGETSSD